MKLSESTDVVAVLFNGRRLLSVLEADESEGWVDILDDVALKAMALPEPVDMSNPVEIDLPTIRRHGIVEFITKRDAIDKLSEEAQKLGMKEPSGK